MDQEVGTGIEHAMLQNDVMVILLVYVPTFYVRDWDWDVRYYIIFVSMVLV